MEKDAEAPVTKRVAQEEEVAPAELGHERDRHEARNVRLRQIVDVVVLRDGEALPATLGLTVDLAEQPENHGSVVERDPRVSVRHVDDGGVALGRHVKEPPLVPTERDVRDDVDPLVRVGERTLEHQVEIRRDDQLARRFALTKQLGHIREGTLHRPGS